MIADLYTPLKMFFGFDQFRQGQEQTVCQLLDGNSSLAIFPTGSGKSLCYQLTATQLPHLTLVVSPLLALMKDQLEFLAQKGIPAASIDSTLTPDQNRKVMSDIRNGTTKILMVSVERFKNERFRQFIQSVPVSMLVVDEAHCISEWGHNFRPDYLKLPAYREALNIPLVLLLTATATRQVKLDMAQKFDISEEHIVQTGFYRPNLDLTVLPVSSAGKNNQLLQSIREQQGPGIVYVTLQHSAEQVAGFLVQQGINASAYHAGFEDQKRQKIQSDFMSGRINVVVATIAFGMGIDKSNIRFVIHYDLPKSIENYSQEIGRAGRDGLPSNCITLANLDGLNTVENFIYGDTPELSGIEYVLDNIRNECQNSQWELQLHGLSTASNIRQLPMKTLLVQLELLGVLQPLYAYFADFKYKLLQPASQILEGFNGERKEFLSSVFANTQFKRVWGTLEFEALFRAYSCDRKRVVSALDYLQEQRLIELETKKITEVFQINLAALADPELGQRLYEYFADKEEKEIKRIAALISFFELDSCLSRNLSIYFDDHESAENCGHCSSCRGLSARLEYSVSPSWPSDEQLQSDLSGLRQHLAAKHSETISIDTQCRFLAGISVPLFARNKVRQLSGFGCCESLRYADLLKKVESLG
ncbi:MAG: RecQ family ATP-dependent DNA helicase [Amphritea sp.]|nr:RecQ family ATP-dependent DNA helicase [Amphritea sp.]